MPPEQTLLFMRVGLIEAIVILGFFVLAFWALTIFSRPLLATAGLRESLLARLAGAAVLASIAAGGATSVVINFVESAWFPGPNVSVEAGRNQAVLAIVVALAIAAAAAIRIEIYHRRASRGPAPEDEGEWQVEEPGAIRKR